MIVGEIKKVANTKIFVAPDRNNEKQITIYSNTIDSVDHKNAMILPVPYPESINLINLSHYANIFDDCDKCFERIPTKHKSFGFTTNSAEVRLSYLPVHNVGSYEVSIAMNLNDLEHVDPNLFVISTELINMLRTSYTAGNFGFIICKLMAGEHTYHPFAYSHNIANGKLFIPTKHFHVHKKKRDNNHFYADDWEHDFYIVNSKNIHEDLDNYIDIADKYKHKPSTFINTSSLNWSFGDIKHFGKYQIFGRHKNIDLILNTV